ncbi:MAG: right-handed parallel beta-helix repeat-containing protein [Candidatus Bathyarchaeota archaeon]|nr:right-handed parallel beta-helix repeat-containing protein [Candidatus Bathyarchaeota archaeon]
MRQAALILALAVLFASTMLSFRLANFATAQDYTTIIIRADGSIEGTDKIQRTGDVYVFTGNVSGNIKVRKGNIIIDGAGLTLNADNGTGIEIASEATRHPSELDVWNVTVRNLRITNFHIGIKCEFGGNHTFYGNYISNDFISHNGTGGFTWESLGIALWGSTGNNITHCTIGGSPAIYMHFAVSNNFVVENNIIFGAHLAISGIETFERNYWRDYLQRYPNASEVDSSGVWDTPHSIADSTGFENRVFQDNHPLVNPVSIPNFALTLPTITSPQQFSITLFLLVASVIIAVVAFAIGALAYLKNKSKAKNLPNN